MQLRAAVIAERDALEALQWRASLNNPGDREALLAHPDAIQLPEAQIAAGHVSVAEKDGAIVGFCVVLPRDDGDAELDGLFVEPGLWRGGIGRALVEAGAELARKRRARRLHVVANPHALGFYRATGFAPSGELATRFGTGITMVMTLDR